MARLRPNIRTASGTVAKQISPGALKTSIGRIGQQKGIKLSQTSKRNIAVAKRKREVIRQRTEKARAFVRKVNAGQITNVSQIPAELKPYISITQTQLNQIIREKERRRRDREKRRKIRRAARRKTNRGVGYRVRKKKGYSSAPTLVRVR